MYVTQNLYQSNATFIDLDDKEFFHHCLQAAVDTLNDYAQLSVDEIKKRYTPVIYASTVTGKTKDDQVISRIEMNERARRKYLIFDADFNEDEVERSNQLRQNLIDLAEKLKTPLVIYPTISFPKKPRFRAVLFSKRALDHASYVQAMRWLYHVLNEKPTDASDLSMNSNNNAPCFNCKEQIEMIVDTTQDKDLKPLEPALWSSFPKPKLQKKAKIKKGQSDEYNLSGFWFEKAKETFKNSKQAQTYLTFWPILHSLARAELNEQLTEDEVIEFLDTAAEAGNDQATIEAWKVENAKEYRKERTRVERSQSLYESATPLADLPVFAKIKLYAEVEEEE